MNPPAPTGESSQPNEALPKQAINDEATGLPALRNWPAVYLFVLGVFVLWVALLAVLPRFFS